MTFKTMLGFERAIDEKKIEIRGLDKVEPLNICADEDMINQVVYNLIDNAVKFTNEGGYIEGAGLGLYIVKTIIDMHGGQITVNSEPGEYTQFVFWLPLR